MVFSITERNDKTKAFLIKGASATDVMLHVIDNV
ncbi:MAG: hypothetical protein M2R45_04977 [Verrucomicrobia subdivision 3 bacterium]|nr:hypothetical protein [Limisphaerales bacterium]MCS1414076.1 hypothetical protein [Limisphaerales bacterium]